jgi:SOS-response transcriptional repressor LexA
MARESVAISEHVIGNGWRYKSTMLSDWLRTSMKHAGISQAEMARQLTNRLGRSIDRAAVNKMAAGTRKIAADELLGAADVLGVQPPAKDETATTLAGPIPLPQTAPLRYAGEVRAGDWLSVDELNQDHDHTEVPSAVPMHPGYLDIPQFAWRVRGDSMDQAGILEGMWAVTTPYLDYIDKVGELDNNNYVIVQRTRHGGSEFEYTIKEVQFARKGMRLVPRSSNPVHKELFIDLDPSADNDTEEVSLKAVVLWVVRDMAPRPRR